MIFQEVTTGKQMALRGWSCKTPSQVITIPTEKSVVEFCTCNFFCNYSEKVFADVNDDSNEYKNDFKSFLASPKDVTSSVTFTLITPKDGEVVLNDNTFGEYFAQGFNTEQPLQIGLRIDWVKVLPVHGEGDYKVKISQTDFGNTVDVETHILRLRNWDEIRSNNTVKLEYNQKGKILNGENYSGITWKNMLRLEGKFGNHKPQYEINRLQDSNYQDLDVQTMKFNTYQLQTELIPSEVGKTITDNLVLTDEIFVSVNDVFNYEQYRNLKVVFEGNLETSDDYARNNMKSLQITFKDKFSKLKRNFK
jgi:hypothetical protein